MSTDTLTSSVGSSEGCKKTEKTIKEGLPNFELYKKVYSKCTATGFMATASVGRRPQNSHMLIDESDEDGDEGADVSELLGPHLGDKRPSSSKQQPKQSKKKKGKLPSVDETFQSVCSIMIDRFRLHNHQVDGPAKDSYDLSACSYILDTMGLNFETKYRAIEFLRKQDKEMKKAFVCWEPEFRQFWLTKTLGSE